MTNDQQTILIATLLTGGLCLLVYGLHLPLFMFLPTLPLFSAGLSTHPRPVLIAAFLAALPLTMIDPVSAVFFLCLFAVPSWYFCYCALKSRTLTFSEMPGAHLRIWFPIGITMVHVAVYGCALLAFFTGLCAVFGIVLPTEVTHAMVDFILDIQKTYGLTLDVSISQLDAMIRSSLFISFAMCIWMWGCGLWLHAWAANRMLVKKHISRRPSLAITPFPMPNWLLSLMGICALAALIGGESMQFLGRSCLISLLLPYGFQGAALLHFSTLAWPNRRFLLFFIYFAIAMLMWPVLLLSAFGLWYHLKTLNKQLQGSGTSTK